MLIGCLWITLWLNVNWQGDFSFDALFGNLVNELLPSFQEEEADTAGGHGLGGTEALPNGHARASSDAAKFAQGDSIPLFPEVDALLSLFKDSCKELIDLRKQVYSIIVGVGFGKSCRIHINVFIFFIWDEG